jgi:hypothetical protein
MIRQNKSAQFLLASAAIICLWSVNLPAQPKGPIYSNVRYEDDYSFLNHDGARGKNPFNYLKKIPLGGKVELTFGGHYRFRFEKDNNRRFGASDPPSQSFFLNRLFLFADMSVGPRLRVFSEFKVAGITGNELPAPATARDAPDIQNLFADVWFFKKETTRVGLRGGRQELQFGKQRLISPLDWVNTRRTFDGVRLLANFPKWKLDGFFAYVVQFAPEKLNSANHSQPFVGVYLQRPLKGKTVSAYYLGLKENDPIIVDSRGIAGDFFYHTIGAAFDGAAKNFDWSSEAAYQFGSFGGDGISAYMLSLEGGYTVAKLGVKPRVALGFDIASGDHAAADDRQQTFNQLFPLGHAFFGWADQVARQNIQALSLLLSAKPHQQLVCKLNAFKFFLDEKRDALYNASGVPSRRDPTGLAGKNIGAEVDAEVTINLNIHASLVLGYTRFMPGDFIKNTGPAKTHNLFYLMAPLRF